VGSRVTQFQPGNEVFGNLSIGYFGDFGGFAEYVSATESTLARRRSEPEQPG
jgi:NADPH:quinone reductase-like Zn-dependent oxidoreductase